MAKLKAGNRTSALARKMQESMGPDMGPVDGQDQDADTVKGAPGVMAPAKAEDGSADPELTGEIQKILSEAADGLDAIAEKAPPEVKPKLVKVVADLNKIMMEMKSTPVPSADETSMDAQLDKPGVGPAANSTIY